METTYVPELTIEQLRAIGCNIVTVGQIAIRTRTEPSTVSGWIHRSPELSEAALIAQFGPRRKLFWWPAVKTWLDERGAWYLEEEQ
jgi:hypothetical protein